MLGSLASVIGEPGQKALIDQGTSVLTSLLGGKTLVSSHGRSHTICWYRGGGSKSLMGLLGLWCSASLGKEAA